MRCTPAAELRELIGALRSARQHCAQTVMRGSAWKAYMRRECRRSLSPQLQQLCQGWATDATVEDLPPGYESNSHAHDGAPASVRDAIKVRGRVGARPTVVGHRVSACRCAGAWSDGAPSRAQVVFNSNKMQHTVTKPLRYMLVVVPDVDGNAALTTADHAHVASVVHTASTRESILCASVKGATTFLKMLRPA